MVGRYSVRSMIAAVLCVGFAACVARSRPEVHDTNARCDVAALDSCRSGCGGATPHPESHEGRCEEMLHELCRARCAEPCGAPSAEERTRVDALESRLDHDCGSGEAVEPGTEPPPAPRTTPNSIDRLLL